MGGCPCKNNKIASVSPSASKAVPKSEGSNNTGVGERKIVISNNNPEPPVKVKGVCDHLYDELTVLDGKVYDLFKKTRMDGTGDDYQWLQVQRQIRQWKMELRHRCPEEELLNMTRELVNAEYSKMFIIYGSE